MRRVSWVVVVLGGMLGCGGAVEGAPDGGSPLGDDAGSADASGAGGTDAAGPAGPDAGSPMGPDAAGSGGSDAGGSMAPDAWAGGDAAVSGPPPAPPVAPTAPAAPMPPTASNPPEITCPTGWRSVPSTSGGAPDPVTDYATCEPYPTDDPTACPRGEAHFVGTAGCQSVGDPCPSGDWPDGIDALPSVIFVNDNAIGIGSGNTRATAYRTIGQALARATAGTTVAVAKGTYDEVLTIPNGVTVLGACAAQTVIEPTAGYDRTDYTDGVVRAAAAATGTLENFTIVPSVTLVGLSAIGDRNLVARGVTVSSAFRAGLYVSGGASLIAEGLVVDATETGADGTDGLGAFSGGSTLRITRGVILGSHDVGVGSIGGTVTLEDVAVIATEARLSDGSLGHGLLLRSGAVATVERSLFDSNETAALAVADAGTRLTLTDSVVRRTDTSETSFDGFGLFVDAGAEVVATRCTFDRNQSIGAIVAGTLSLAHVAVTRTRQLADGSYGRGLDVELGGRVDIDHVVLDRNRDNAVFVSDAGSSLVASNLTVLRTAPGSASGDGVGAIHVRSGASATITLATLADDEEGGIHAFGAGTTVSVTDVVLRDIAASASAQGLGILIEDGARLELTRASLARAEHLAVFASGAGAELVATDLRVEGTRPSATDGRGWALRAQGGARVSVERGVLDGSTEIGVFARDPSTTVSLIDTAISNVNAAADGSEGFGLLAFGEATLRVERATVTASQSVGVVASDVDTTVSLTDVRVSGTAPSPDGTAGWGAAVQDGAALTATRVEIAESVDVGVLVIDSSLTAVDLRVSEVAQRACLATSSCPATVRWESGMGLVGVNASQISARSMEIESAARCGLLTSADPVGSGAAAGQTLELTDSAVYASAIGFCQQLDSDPPSAGLYLDAATNGVNFQRTTYVPPLPVSFF